MAAGAGLGDVRAQRGGHESVGAPRQDGGAARKQSEQRAGARPACAQRGERPPPHGVSPRPISFQTVVNLEYTVVNLK
eukprot:6266456-Pyramimonas_sp.AAC.1